MIEHFDDGVEWSQTIANDRARQIASGVYGSNWNRAGWPTNCREYQADGVPVSADIDSIFKLFFALKIEGPIYAYYSRNNGPAHLVVVTGVDLLNRIVYTNNPWGIGGPQNYNDFLQGFLGGPEDGSFPLRFYILPT